MKKKLVTIAAAAVLAMGAFGLFGCAQEQAAEGTDAGTEASAPTGDISVYSREDGSGTRGAFVELLGIEQEDASGEKVDMTTTSAAITNSTAVMMTSVSDDPNAIGYISLGSLDESMVKALEIDGVAASVDTVKDGSYKVSRPFNVVTKGELTDVAQDFMNFIMSPEGQAIVEEEGYISLENSGESYASAGLEGKITVAGSSSVSSVMEVLAEEYEALNEGVDVEVNTSDSTTGVNMALEGSCDLGMASRELAEDETAAGAQATVIAQDGIAIIVNLENGLAGLTSDQVRDIYTGVVTTWDEVAEQA